MQDFVIFLFGILALFEVDVNSSPAYMPQSGEKAFASFLENRLIHTVETRNKRNTKDASVENPEQVQSPEDRTSRTKTVKESTTYSETQEYGQTTDRRRYKRALEESASTDNPQGDKYEDKTTNNSEVGSTDSPQDDQTKDEPRNKRGTPDQTIAFTEAPQNDENGNTIRSKRDANDPTSSTDHPKNEGNNINRDKKEMDEPVATEAPVENFRQERDTTKDEKFDAAAEGLEAMVEMMQTPAEKAADVGGSAGDFVKESSSHGSSGVAQMSGAGKDMVNAGMKIMKLG